MLPRWTSSLGNFQFLQSVLIEPVLKKVQQTQKYINSSIYNLSLNILYQKKIHRRSKTEEGVVAAAVSTKRIKNPFACRLPDGSSVYTAELRAILLALKHVYYSKEKSFLVLSDSLSSLQSILNLKYDHPVLVQILELYTE